MGDPVKDAWNEVAEGFSKLGQAMKERYQGGSEGSGGEPAAGAGSGASEEGLRQAFERFVDAGRDVGQRAVDVVRDSDVNAQAKHAAASLNDALSATVDMIGREVSGWFGRSDRSPTRRSDRRRCPGRHARGCEAVRHRPRHRARRLAPGGRRRRRRPRRRHHHLAAPATTGSADPPRIQRSANASRWGPVLEKSSGRR